MRIKFILWGKEMRIRDHLGVKISCIMIFMFSSLATLMFAASVFTGHYFDVQSAELPMVMAITVSAQFVLGLFMIITYVVD